MNLSVEELESQNVVLLDKLTHSELVPFVQHYIKKRTKSAVFYYISSGLTLLLCLYCLLRGFKDEWLPLLAPKEQLS